MLKQMNSGLPVLARAIVVANQDPDQLGRVKVNYPWRGKQNTESPSEWAQVCLPLASKESGFFYLPEKGDEVLVFFEGGNLDHPVILGSFYGKKAKPGPSGRAGDFNANGKNTLRYLKTRTGHLLCFDESDDNAGIVVQDKENRKFEIQTTKKKVLISDEKGNKIELDGKNIEISTSKANIKLSENQMNLSFQSSKVQIEENEMQIKASDSQVTLSKGNLTIHSSGSISLGDGASEALIKGNAFLQTFNNHVHSTAMGPSGPPLMPALPTVLSRKVSTS